MKHLKIMIVFSFSLFTACSKLVKDQDLSFRKVPTINCVFSQDKVWEVLVKMSGDESNYSGEAVNNAVVKIITGGQILEELRYRDSGIYVSSSGLKPQVNIEYELEVVIPGFPSIKASDKIPGPILIDSVKVDTTNIFQYSYNPFYEPVKVFEANLFISDNEQSAKYYVGKPVYYKQDELTIYKVTQATIDSLKKINRYNSVDSAKLNQIFGVSFFGRTDFQKKLEEVYRPQLPSDFIYQFSRGGFFNSYSNELYLPHQVYIADLNFTQIENFNALFFGEKTAASVLQNYPLRTLYNYFPGGGYSIVNGDTVKIDAEFFLQISSVSNAGYKYFTSYAQSIVNRGNPFSEHVNVYSNIKNGKGIFAGQNATITKIW